MAADVVVDDDDDFSEAALLDSLSLFAVEEDKNRLEPLLEPPATRTDTVMWDCLLIEANDG